MKRTVGFVVVEWEVVRVAVARTALATAVARAEAMAAERVREPKGQEVAEETVLVNTMAVVVVVAAVGTGQVTPEKVEAERPPWPGVTLPGLFHETRCAPKRTETDIFGVKTRVIKTEALDPGPSLSTESV